MDRNEEPSRAELTEKLRKLSLIHVATNDAVKDLHAKLDAAAKRNAVLERQLSSANQNVEQQKEIVRSHLDQSQESEAALVDEIRRLKKKLREVGVGDLD